jgi:hypothetical protein
MNAEYMLDSCKTLLSTYLAAELVIIDAESSAVTASPVPAEYHFGARDPEELTSFPSIQLIGKNSSGKDQYQWQDRTFRIDVVAWIVEVDPENLHRFILRYADAISRVLRDEDKWASNSYSPVIGTATYSDLYKTSFGLAQGCQVQLSVNDILI